MFLSARKFSQTCDVDANSGVLNASSCGSQNTIVCSSFYDGGCFGICGNTDPATPSTYSCYCSNSPAPAPSLTVTSCGCGSNIDAYTTVSCNAVTVTPPTPTPTIAPTMAPHTPGCAPAAGCTCGFPDGSTVFTNDPGGMSGSGYYNDSCGQPSCHTYGGATCADTDGGAGDPCAGMTYPGSSCSQGSGTSFGANFICLPCTYGGTPGECITQIYYEPASGSCTVSTPTPTPVCQAAGSCGYEQFDPSGGVPNENPSSCRINHPTQQFDMTACGNCCSGTTHVTYGSGSCFEWVYSCGPSGFTPSTPTPTPSPTPTATPPDPNTTLMPGPDLAFGDVRQGMTSSSAGSAISQLYATFTNTGLNPANNCVFTGMPNSNFTVSGACPSSIPIGSACSVTVYGGSTPTFTLSGPSSSSLTLSCSNVLLPTTVNMAEYGFTWPVLTFDLLGNEFLNVAVGSPVTTDPFTIRNAGDRDAKNCTVSSVGTNAAQFTIVNASSCNTISAHGSCTFGVTATAPPGYSFTPMKTTIKVNCMGTSSANFPPPGYSIAATTNADGYYFNGPSCPANAKVVNGLCLCPFGYVARGNYCKPKLPSAEFLYSVGGDPATEADFPVCGLNGGANAQNSRLPVTTGLQYSNASSNYLPLSKSRTTTYPATTGSPYPYSSAKSVNGETVPDYHYAQLAHCSCMGQLVGGADIVADPTLTSLYPSLPPDHIKSSGDTLDYVSSFDASGVPNKTYGMVAFSSTANANGSLASNFNGCACPNVNEYPALINVSPNAVKGVECIPAIAPGTGRIFAMFDPSVDDITGGSQVFTRTAVTGLPNIINGGYTEPVFGGSVPTTVTIVSSQSATNVVKPYARHIWKCQIGYHLDLTQNPPACVWNTDQGCNATSPVGSDLNGNPIAFANIVNKKLACCMNNEVKGVTASTTQIKFDCVDNSKANFADFDTLWRSTDATRDGGQMNALILTGADGKPITGFFTTDGVRCSEFSEFDSAGIQPGILNPLGANMSTQQTLVNGTRSMQFTAVGAPITPPTGTGYTQLTAGFPRAVVAPHPSDQSADENLKAIRCPILVRAAIVTTCPAPTAATNAIQYTQTNGGITRCPAAASIQVHIRAEQVFEIAGTPKMITMDTVVDKKGVNSISMDQILRRKNGSDCLPGMVASPSGCHY